ncbi:MAG: ankyrin repeat domain-containing protein, partial [Proteobacteria bacterium]|nr:ankyrin repeat domain-containing protein [Pseudomonadota bacterium]
TVLMAAARQGWTTMINDLLAKGVNVDEVDNNNNTALSIAAENEHSPECKLLLEKGASINNPALIQKMLAMNDPDLNKAIENSLLSKLKHNMVNTLQESKSRKAITPLMKGKEKSDRINEINSATDFATLFKICDKSKKLDSDQINNIRQLIEPLMSKSEKKAITKSTPSSH